MCYTKSIANGFLPVLLLTAKLFSRNEETGMTVSYKKLWKLLIDKDMKKKDLEKAAGISNYVISKMNKGENITVDIVGKICSALDRSLQKRLNSGYSAKPAALMPNA